MPKQRFNDYEEARERITLSQQIAADHPEFEEYSGADIELSQRIAKINVYIAHGILSKDDPDVKFLKEMWVERVKAILASSDKTDILSKLGFRRKQGRKAYGRLQKPDSADLPK